MTPPVSGISNRAHQLHREEGAQDQRDPGPEHQSEICQQEIDTMSEDADGSFVVELSSNQQDTAKLLSKEKHAGQDLWTQICVW